MNSVRSLTWSNVETEFIVFFNSSDTNNVKKSARFMPTLFPNYIICDIDFKHC